MKIMLHKSDQHRHRLSIETNAGSREERVLETKSFLAHDLMHFAFESETRVDYGFWGRLASGESMAALYDAPSATDSRLMDIERLVAPLQTLWHGRMNMEQYLEHAQAVPALHVDRVLVTAVLERMRRLWGEWNATPYGAAMQLEWS
jgi:hypothetical protein